MRKHTRPHGYNPRAGHTARAARAAIGSTPRAEALLAHRQQSLAHRNSRRQLAAWTTSGAAAPSQQRHQSSIDAGTAMAVGAEEQHLRHATRARRSSQCGSTWHAACSRSPLLQAAASEATTGSQNRTSAASGRRPTEDRRCQVRCTRRRRPALRDVWRDGGEEMPAKVSII